MFRIDYLKFSDFRTNGYELTEIKSQLKFQQKLCTTRYVNKIQDINRKIEVSQRRRPI